MLQTENSAVTTNQGDFSNNNNNNEDASASKKRQQGSFVRRHPHIGESMLSMSQKKQMLDSSETKEDMAGLSPLEASYIRAFHNAQKSFGEGQDRPSLPPLSSSWSWKRSCPTTKKENFPSAPASTRKLQTPTNNKNGLCLILASLPYLRIVETHV